MRYPCGAFPASWAELGAMTAFACYDLENVKTVGYDVLVNRPKTAAYRAPSAPMAAFAVESVIDELAQEDRHGPGRVPHQERRQGRHQDLPTARSTARSASARRWRRRKNHPHMKAPLGKNQGRGMACGFWFNFGGQTCTDPQHRRRRHGLACRRHRRRRRLARLAVADGGGGARHSLRRRSRRWSPIPPASATTT